MKTYISKEDVKKLAMLPDINISTLAEMPNVKYWFDNGRIHSSVGSSIGYEEWPMSEKEAIKLAASGCTVLGSKP